MCLLAGLKSAKVLLLNAWTCWNCQCFLSAWGDLISFSGPGGTERIAGLWFAMEESVLGLALCPFQWWPHERLYTESPLTKILALLMCTLCLNARETFSEFSFLIKVSLALWMILRCCLKILFWFALDIAGSLSLKAQGSVEFCPITSR